MTFDNKQRIIMIPARIVSNPLTIATSVVVILLVVAYSWPLPEWNEEISVAFIGNSVQTRSLGYLSTTDNLHESGKIVVILHGIANKGNDFPRFMQVISGGKISQGSCLHGDATIPNMLKNGKSKHAQ